MPWLHYKFTYIEIYPYIAANCYRKQQWVCSYV